MSWFAKTLLRCRLTREIQELALLWRSDQIQADLATHCKCIASPSLASSHLFSAACMRRGAFALRHGKVCVFFQMPFWPITSFIRWLIETSRNLTSSVYQLKFIPLHSVKIFQDHPIVYASKTQKTTNCSLSQVSQNLSSSSSMDSSKRLRLHWAQ